MSGKADITIGTNNMLIYPPESQHPPAFIAPDTAPAQVLTEQIDRLIREMYRMSGIDSVIGVQSAKSGVARQKAGKKMRQDGAAEFISAS